MRNKILATLALILSLGATMIAGTGSAHATALAQGPVTVVLGGGVADSLPNGVSPTSAHPIQGSTAQHFIGTGAWQSIPAVTSGTRKFELYIDPTAAPFNSLGSFSLNQIASVSYYTNRGSNVLGHDFYLTFYTAPCGAGGDATWYCHRLQGLPLYANNVTAPANAWSKWTTDAPTNQLTFYDAKRTALGFYGGPTLANLQAGPLNWASYPTSGGSTTVDYSAETIRFVHISLDSSQTGFDGYLDDINITLKNGKSLTIDLEASGLLFDTAATAIPADGSIPATISIDLNNVISLYGYQFQVNYDSSMVNASGTFVDSFFSHTLNASVPPGWSASCASGVCRFAVSKVSPGTALTGSGTVAQIAFTGIAPGTVNLTFSSDILSDKDGTALTHVINTSTITVYGSATVNGTVNLQGRSTPLDSSGTVTLIDQSGFFGQTVVNYGPSDGTFSATVPVLSGGTTYKLDAAHGLYLTNELTGQNVGPTASLSVDPTNLLGGDANNDGTISTGDLTCIGGSFGGAPVACSGGGSPDITADSTVNILDLVLAGGNYGLSSPQGW